MKNMDDEKGFDHLTKEGSLTQDARQVHDLVLLEDRKTVEEQAEELGRIENPLFFYQKKKPDYLKKSNVLIHAKTEDCLSPNQHKAMNKLFHFALNNEHCATHGTDRVWQIPTKEVLSVMGTDSTNTIYLRKTFEEMSNIKMYSRWFGKRGEGNAFINIFNMVVMYDGFITYKIDSGVLEILQGSGASTNLNLLEQVDLKRRCSNPLYEIACRYLMIGESKWFSFPELRSNLLAHVHVPKNAQTWGMFNERYLQPAIEEINNSKTKKCSISLDFKRIGRTVDKIKILIKRREGSELEVGDIKNTDEDIKAAMTELGLGPAAMRNLMKIYINDQILKAVEKTKSRLNDTSRKPIKSASVFLKLALKNIAATELDDGNQCGLFDVEKSESIENEKNSFQQDEDAPEWVRTLNFTKGSPFKEKISDITDITPKSTISDHPKIEDVSAEADLMAEFKLIAEIDKPALFEQYNAANPVSYHMAMNTRGRMKISRFMSWYKTK